MFNDDVLSDSEFEGGVFSKRIGGGRAGASVRLGDRGVIATTEEDGEFFVSYSECQLEMGGASGHMVFCRTPDRSVTIFAEDRRFPLALKQAATGQLHEDVEAMIVDRKRRWWNSQLTIVGLLLGTVALLVGGYFALIATAQAAIVAVPVSVDEQIGEAALPTVMQEFGTEIKNTDAIEPLQKLVDSLAKHGPLPDLKYKVLIVDTDGINAVALPGGTIIVFRGLIDKVDTAGQLAGVLAHEISHVTKRHHLRHLVKAAGVVIAVEVMLGDVGGLVALGTQLATHATLNQFSQEQESEADREGLKLMVAAGYDPIEMATMFEKLPDLNLPGVLSWLSSHPDSMARAAAIRQQIAELPKREYNAPELDLQTLRNRLNKSHPTEPDAK